MTERATNTAADLFAAIRAGDQAKVDRLLERDRGLVDSRDENGLSPILAALYRGRNEIARTILRMRPKLDIFEAAAAGDLDRARELIGSERSLANAMSSDGYSPLGLAAFFKHRDVVRVLLEAGADPRSASRDQGFTPLHSAVATDAGAGDVELVRMLLDAGADPQARNRDGGTAIHTAAFVGDREILELLLARGADPRTKTNDGTTAGEIAAQRGHAEIAALLRSRTRTGASAGS